MTIVAILIACAYMAFFILLFLVAFRLGAGSCVKNLVWHDKWNRRIFLLFAVGGFLLCLHLIKKNNYVYYWDYGSYWILSYETMNSLFADPFQTLKTVYNSILTDNYNKLLPLLLSLPLKVFGYTFSRYVVLNFMCFLVPTWFIVVAIIWKVLLRYNPELEKSKAQCLITLFLLVCVSTFNVFYIAMLRGYNDVGCLVPTLLAILLFVDYNCLKLNKKQIIRDLLIGAMLLVAFLFRRHFSFFGVGYAFALFMYSAYIVFQARRDEDLKLKIRNAFLNLFIIGGSAILVLLLFFRKLVVKVLKSNYTEMYSAYDAPIGEKISGVTSQLGLIVILLAIIAIILCLFTKKCRKITLFCALASSVTMAFFFTIQQMGIHHVYCVAGEFCILMILGVYQICLLLRNYKFQLTTLVLCSVILICGTLNCFVQNVRPAFAPFSRVFSNTYTPLTRSDIPELKNLVNYVNGLTVDTNKHVYVCASGFILNGNIMERLELPYNNNALHNQYRTSDVDLRDGFNVGFLKSEYIIGTDPVQLHLKEGSQEVVRFLNEEVKNESSPIGKHFKKLDASFKLGNNVTAYVYEKVGEFEDEDLRYIADYYSNLYPGKEALFANRILN